MTTASVLRAQNFDAPNVENNSWKRQDDDVILCTNNIMFDNRVYRGNTYSKPVVTEVQRRHEEFCKRNQKARQRGRDNRRKKVNYK